MKYIVVSDIHGSLYYAKKIEKIIEQEQPIKIILLGDLYYHGPRNPLPLEYNPMEVANILNKYHNLIVCIKGNCDAEVDQMISKFNIGDDYKEIINGKRFYFTHGHKYNIDNIPNEVDILVYGHFHTGFIRELNNMIIINSGSITLPKNNTKNSYLVITDKEIVLKDVDGNVIEIKKIL